MHLNGCMEPAAQIVRCERHGQSTRVRQRSTADAGFDLWAMSNIPDQTRYRMVQSKLVKCTSAASPRILGAPAAERLVCAPPFGARTMSPSNADITPFLTKIILRSEISPEARAALLVLTGHRQT
jgi:hypothetical protein